LSEQLSKEALVRLAWITELRRQGDRQCDGEMFCGKWVCALGLLAEVSGLGRRANAIVGRWKSFAPIGKRAGLTPAQTEVVWVMNDNGCTFSEIADVVAAGVPVPTIERQD
jgi:hypothetical protein